MEGRRKAIHLPFVTTKISRLLPLLFELPPLLPLRRTELKESERQWKHASYQGISSVYLQFPSTPPAPGRDIAMEVERKAMGPCLVLRGIFRLPSLLFDPLPSGHEKQDGWPVGGNEILIHNGGNLPGEKKGGWQAKCRDDLCCIRGNLPLKFHLACPITATTTITPLIRALRRNGGQAVGGEILIHLKRSRPPTFHVSGRPHPLQSTKTRWGAGGSRRNRLFFLGTLSARHPFDLTPPLPAVREDKMVGMRKVIHSSLILKDSLRSISM